MGSNEAKTHTEEAISRYATHDSCLHLKLFSGSFLFLSRSIALRTWISNYGNKERSQRRTQSLFDALLLKRQRERNVSLRWHHIASRSLLASLMFDFIWNEISHTKCSRLIDICFGDRPCVVVFSLASVKFNFNHKMRLPHATARLCKMQIYNVWIKLTLNK